MGNVLPFARANSIKTALQTCNLLTGQSISNKFINWFRLNLPPQMAKFFHICKWITPSPRITRFPLM